MVCGWCTFRAKAAQLAMRIVVVQSRVVDIEKAEVRGSLTLDSLEREQVIQLARRIAEQPGSSLWKDE